MLKVFMSRECRDWHGFSEICIKTQEEIFFVCNILCNTRLKLMSVVYTTIQLPALWFPCLDGLIWMA